MTPHRILAGIFYAVAGLLFVIGGVLEGIPGLKTLVAAVLFALVGGVCSIVAALGELRPKSPSAVAELLAEAAGDPRSGVAPPPSSPPPAPRLEPELPRARPYVRPPWEKPPA